MHSYINGRSAAILPLRTIRGHSLAHCQLTKQQRAVLAADVIDGLAAFVPSHKEVATIFGVSTPYINVARRLSAGKRTAILRGWDPVSFTELMNPPRQVSLVGPVIPNMKVITDADLENLVRNAGIERVLEAACAVEHT
jgi:hypothetical protein